MEKSWNFILYFTWEPCEFYYMKMGYKGVFITRTCFPNVLLNYTQLEEILKSFMVNALVTTCMKSCLCLPLV